MIAALGECAVVHDDGRYRVLHVPGRTQPYTVQRRVPYPTGRHMDMLHTHTTLRFCATAHEALAALDIYRQRERTLVSAN